MSLKSLTSMKSAKFGRYESHFWRLFQGFVLLARNHMPKQGEASRDKIVSRFGIDEFIQVENEPALKL